eukprot:TRINITY_DN74400_c0_g1_i1.p1 TRINITY_DN74400_c0_g1~~TRINITY_DN74400_c0_g1_i1.p1  ORF type:complete len:607 (-),score=121.30 TRINITY_DN74400_c0_g1_i1:237-2057(-)
MGFDIYADVPRKQSMHEGTDKEVLEQIFDQHCEATHAEGMMPVVSWYHAAKSLAREFPEKLGTLTNGAMIGRVFQMIDDNHDGILSKTEFIEGIYGLLNPTSAEAKTLLDRMSKGIVKGGKNYDGVETVAIIGAGVAGLQTAVRLMKIGKKVKIFEKMQDVGGVWQKNYADFGLQVPKELYEFPDFPYPEDMKAELFPHGPQVQEYIQRYAQHHKLYDVISLGTPVKRVDPRGTQRGWTVSFEQQGALVVETFDFLVVATGMYGWPPHVPVARGSKTFKGDILHSCTFTDRKMAAGKKVVVVGGGKSAVDNAVAAAKEGVSATLLCRSWHWPVPRYLLNLVPFKYGTYSRFGHWMLEPHHEEGPVSKWFHGTCAPVKWMWWRVVEGMFRYQFKLSRDMVPDEPIDTDLFTGGQILSYEFRDQLQDNKVNVTKGSIDKFEADGVVLTDGTKVEADLVIYATGFVKSYDIFDPLIQEKLDIQKDGLYLYRSIIAPQVPDLAFIGCEVSTFNNILTHGMQALWLEKMLSGELELPPPGRMERYIEKERSWKRSWMPASSARGSIWQLHMMRYHDNLCADMGVARMRKMPNCLGELFMPYAAADYRGLFK